jgi:hypothetical protein
VIASLQVFHDAQMPRLRAKSLMLTAYLEALLDSQLSSQVQILTPRDPEQRGAQISIRVPGMDAKELQKQLAQRGVIVDERKPDIIRVAPAPLYNSFTDVLSFMNVLMEVLLKAPIGGYTNLNHAAHAHHLPSPHVESVEEQQQVTDAAIPKRRTTRSTARSSPGQ